ncbi:UNVERIFIED_ORG: hypothetical protein ABIC48_001704 [Burkholderia territorii]
MRVAGRLFLRRRRARFGDETSATTAPQGFRTNGNFNLPLVGANHANARRATSRFRYSGKP